MVGFNRRFSPHIQKIRELLSGRSEPLAMHCGVNAGIIPANHWVQDPERGGGRIIGEAVHFFDLFSYIAGSRIISVAAVQIGEGAVVRDDKMSIVLWVRRRFHRNGQLFRERAKSYPKETLEVFSQGRVLRMENFRVTHGFGFPKFRKFKTWRQDKGHGAEFAAFVDRVSSGGPH